MPRTKTKMFLFLVDLTSWLLGSKMIVPIKTTGKKLYSALQMLILVLFVVFIFYLLLTHAILINPVITTHILHKDSFD